MTFAYTALDEATAALAIATILLVVVSVVVGYLSLKAANRSDARRSQPVVIAHQAGPRQLDQGYPVYLTNEGTGTAFNVRFGVRLGGTEYAVGGGRGSRYVVGPGQRVPNGGGELWLDPGSAEFARGEGVEAKAEFWARYENAFGEVYETSNPADSFADFKITRIRPRRLRKNEEEQAIRRKRSDDALTTGILRDAAEARRESAGDAEAADPTSEDESRDGTDGGTE